MNPICEDPFNVHGSITASADQAHHIKPLLTHPELAFVLDNLMSLCTKCHARIESDASNI
jgi:5-methylcytosine-specific restriction endonuclease McrA